MHVEWSVLFFVGSVKEVDMLIGGSGLYGCSSEFPMKVQFQTT